MRKHLKAHAVSLAAILGAVACGLVFAHTEHVPAWHGLYCAAANMMTEGDCDVAATTNVGYIVNTIEHVCLVALAGAVLSIFTSRVAATLAQEHIEAAEERIKTHTDARIRHHLGKPPANKEGT